jgi:aryl-alcohol dehydrogenase-like predicted oxidoreductase
VPLAQAVEETLEGFHLPKAAGKVRFFGITGDDVAKLAVEADTGLFDSVQTFRHYTLINQAAGAELLPTAARHTMGVINGSPLGMGLLTGNDPREMNRPASPEVAARVDRMRALAQRLGISLPELAIRFSLSQPGISVTIPGTKSVARLEENVAAWRAGPLPDEVLAEIRS